MFEVRLESVTNGVFDYVEHIFSNKDAAIDAVKRHVPEGFSVHGLNKGPVTYAYGHVVDLSTNTIVYRDSREYPL